jgi:DNA-binding NarL/FixJ family response regulator
MTILRDEAIDLMVLDLSLPGLGGLEFLRKLQQRPVRPRVLVLSMHAEPFYVARALEAGATGYVSKNAAPEELLLAVRRTLLGQRYIESELAQRFAVQTLSPEDMNSPAGRLSIRDLEIMRQLARGRSLSEIADALGVSYKTVANTCTGIKSKLGVARTADLVRIATELG